LIFLVTQEILDFTRPSDDSTINGEPLIPSYSIFLDSRFELHLSGGVLPVHFCKNSYQTPAFGQTNAQITHQSGLSLLTSVTATPTGTQIEVAPRNSVDSAQPKNINKKRTSSFFSCFEAKWMANKQLIYSCKMPSKITFYKTEEMLKP
jgi:hypothetical protein